MKTAQRILLLNFWMILNLSLSSAAMGDTKNPDSFKKENFQVEVLEFRDLWDSSRETVLKPERPRLFRRHKNKTENSRGRNIPIKVHAPTSGGPYPVVIISHGAGGNWNTHYAQAHDLASHGYVVLCPEHIGSNTERMKSSLRVMHNLKQMTRDSREVLGRPKDVSFAIEKAGEWNQTDQKLRGRIDLNRIGVMGHSFGAFTTMAVAGMRPALNWLEPSVAPGSGLGPNLSDNRVKCGIALSPHAPGEPFFLNESYSSLRIPLLGISGTKDQQQSGEPPIERYESFKLWPSMQGKNIFVWLTNASHLDFTDSTGGEEPRRDSSTRNDVQRIVRAATLKFFNECLKGDSSAENALTVEGLKPYLGGAINNLEVLRK